MTARRWYGLITRGFPPAFRDRFAGEVLDLIQEQRAALGTPRAAAVAAFHLATTLDLFTALLRERALVLRRASGTLLLAAAAANTGYDLANPSLAMGVIAWALTVIALVTGLRFWTRRPRRSNAA